MPEIVLPESVVLVWFSKMKRCLFLAFLASFLFGNSCRLSESAKKHSFPITTPPPLLFPWADIKFEGGDGTSLERGVIIKGTRSEHLGVSAEKTWLMEKFPGYELKSQFVTKRDDRGRVFDVMEIQVAGELMKIYFNITEFFDGDDFAGKWVFHGKDGVELSGNICGIDMPVEKSRPWRSKIGEKTGELIYQTGESTRGLLGKGSVLKGQRVGLWRFWICGYGEAQANFQSDKKNGVEVQWDTNGVKICELNLKDDVFDGKSTWWYPNGNKSKMICYKNNIPHGKAASWHENGAKSSEGTYENGNLICVTNWDINGKPEPSGALNK